MKAKINDIELYYEIHGNGEPIIFIHGWLDDCSCGLLTLNYSLVNIR